MSDHIHNGTAGNVVLGERMAKCILSNLYHIGGVKAAPDISHAEKTGAREVTLTFSNVLQCLYCFELAPELCPFSFCDSEGDVKIKSYFAKENKITFKLERELLDNAAVSAAYGQNPSHLLPVDIYSYLPILSFYRVPIQ